MKQGKLYVAQDTYSKEYFSILLLEDIEDKPLTSQIKVLWCCQNCYNNNCHFECCENNKKPSIRKIDIYYLYYNSLDFKDDFNLHKSNLYNSKYKLPT